MPSTRRVLHDANTDDNSEVSICGSGLCQGDHFHTAGKQLLSKFCYRSALSQC